MMTQGVVMKKVDVVVLTKNSSITLSIVLKGIFEAIPVGELIVVDGGSSDDTLRIARKYGAKIVREEGKLGRARYRGALEVETDWFCFIDSDILLFPFWYKRLVKWTRHPRVAWIGGLPLEQSKILESYARSKHPRHNHPRFQRPVALSNSLLKREIVLGCTEWLRGDIHGGEDSILYDFVESRQYRIVKDLSFFACLHLPDCFLHDIYALYRGGYSSRLRHKGIRIKYLGTPFYLLRKALVAFLDRKDPRLFGYYFIMQGIPWEIKYLGIANRRIDRFIERLEKSSKIIGMRLFWSNPRDSEGNPIIFTETKRAQATKSSGT